MQCEAGFSRSCGYIRRIDSAEKAADWKPETADIAQNKTILWSAANNIYTSIAFLAYNARYSEMHPSFVI